MRENWYDTAQVCLNGHPINYLSISQPEHNKNFCDKCGTPTITKCQSCNAPIKGFYHNFWSGSPPSNVSGFTPISFCDNCGEPYPWTELKRKAAQEFADLQEDWSPEEREIFKKSLDDIIKDTPQTVVAASKFKILAAKLGRAAAEELRKLVVDIASETAKKIILEQVN